MRTTVTDIKESTNGSSGNSGTLLQGFICNWFHKCKTWSKRNHIVLVTHSWYATTHWTHRCQKGKLVHFVQIRWNSSLGYIEISWRRNMSWFFLEVLQNPEAKIFFPYEWFDHPHRLLNTELHPYYAFQVKFRSCNPLETNYTDYVNLLKVDWPQSKPFSNWNYQNHPSTGIGISQYLQQKWKQAEMSSFKDALSWYNNKDVVPTLAAMHKMIAFNHNKDIDMLKLGCRLPNIANVCLHKCTDAKLYPFTEGDK